MAHAAYQHYNTEPAEAGGDPCDNFKRFSSGVRLSAQEEEFIAAGMEHANSFLRWVWRRGRKPVAYGTLSEPITTFTAIAANVGLGALEQKITEKLRTKLDEDNEDSLINDLHSIQITRQRIKSAIFHPLKG